MKAPKNKPITLSHQVLPASQLFQAIFVNAVGKMKTKPVICWDVTDDGNGEPDVEGMVDGELGITLCTDETFTDYWFVGYTGPGENPTDLSGLALEIARSAEDELDEDEDFDDLGKRSDSLDDLEDLDFPPQDMMKNLPVALSQISVLVREQFEREDVPEEWKEWLGFMKKFSQLTEDESNEKK